jgi:hypothetical protein
MFRPPLTPGGFAMAWFWSDDLARVLLEAHEASEAEMRDWIQRPVAIAAAQDTDPLMLARRIAGHENGEQAGAA